MFICVLYRTADWPQGTMASVSLLFESTTASFQG